jgi:hypothetical protein
MGIDWCGLEAILISLRYCVSKQKAIMLGRQAHCLNPRQTEALLLKYDHKNYELEEYSESLFKHLRFENIFSLDNSSYEGASTIHNMNKPISADHKYNYIFDGGTTEHIFNAPQAYENIINMLEVGGIFCSVVPNNNWSGHGMYQFSPEFFLSIFTKKYGMEIKHLYLIRHGDYLENSIDVNGYNSAHMKEFGRNNARIDTSDPVMIVTIAQKISNERVSLLEDPPNQYSYEHHDW